jgi:hypothetical protein
MQVKNMAHAPLALLPLLTIGALVFSGNAALAQEAAKGGELDGMFSLYGQGRSIVFGIIGAGSALTMGTLWLATRLSKRQARKTVAAYDAQLAKYSQDLRKGK